MVDLLVADAVGPGFAKGSLRCSSRPRGAPAAHVRFVQTGIVNIAVLTCRMRAYTNGGASGLQSKSNTSTAFGQHSTRRPARAVPKLPKSKRRLSELAVSHPVGPGSSNGRTAASEAVYRSSNLCPGATALSSSGLGRRPLTAVTRVRLPLGLNEFPFVYKGFRGTSGSVQQMCNNGARGLT